MRALFSLALLVAVAGCSREATTLRERGPVLSVQGPSALQYSAVDVAPAGECIVVPPEAMMTDSGVITVALVSPSRERAARRILVQYDRSGKALSFDDFRDGVGGGQIRIDLRTGRATAESWTPAGLRRWTATAAEMMTRAELGNPADQLQHVTRSCAGLVPKA